MAIDFGAILGGLLGAGMGGASSYFGTSPTNQTAIDSRKALAPFATSAWDEYQNLMKQAREKAGPTSTQQQFYSNLMPAYNQTLQQFGDWRDVLQQQAGKSTDFYSGLPYLTAAQQQLGGALDTSNLMAQDAVAKAFGNATNLGLGKQEITKALYQPTYDYQTKIAGLEAQKQGAQAQGAQAQTAAQRAAAQLATQLTPMSALIPAINAANSEQEAILKGLAAQTNLWNQTTPFAALAANPIQANTPTNNALSSLLGGAATGAIPELIKSLFGGGNQTSTDLFGQMMKGITGNANATTTGNSYIDSMIKNMGLTSANTSAQGMQNAINWYKNMLSNPTSLAQMKNYFDTNDLEKQLGLPEGSLAGTSLEQLNKDWASEVAGNTIDWNNLDWNNTNWNDIYNAELMNNMDWSNMIDIDQLNNLDWSSLLGNTDLFDWNNSIDWNDYGDWDWLNLDYSDF